MKTIRLRLLMERRYARCLRGLLALAIVCLAVSAQGADVSYGTAISPDASLLERDGNDLGTILAGDGFRGRVQQVYDASFFSFLPRGGGWIDAISFRGDRPTAQNRSYVGDGIEVQLSTTSAGVDALSPIFAANVGQDVRVVLSQNTSVLIGDGRTPGDGPYAFLTKFFFGDQPFFYDPAKGNLLVDIAFYKDISTSTYDAENVSGDSVSTLSAFSLNTGQIPTRGTASSLGFVTAFTYHPVPEPSLISLLALATAGGFLLRRATRHCGENPKGKLEKDKSWAKSRSLLTSLLQG